jgi:hypothetical protein
LAREASSDITGSEAARLAFDRDIGVRGVQGGAAHALTIGEEAEEEEAANCCVSAEAIVLGEQTDVDDWEAVNGEAGVHGGARSCSEAADLMDAASCCIGEKKVLVKEDCTAGDAGVHFGAIVIDC